MFTGIVTDIGRVAALEVKGDTRARIHTAYEPDSIAIGASIACNGCCLTAIAKGHETDGTAWFDVEFSNETRAKTNLGDWQTGTRINLERSLCLGDEMGGHVVSGHVDCVSEVLELTQDGDSTRMTFAIPDGYAQFIAQKGSVTLNGTSLTVNDVSLSQFSVNVIPHTKTATTWGDAHQGDKVNLEIDTFARYVARLIDVQNG